MAEPPERPDSLVSRLAAVDAEATRADDSTVMQLRQELEALARELREPAGSVPFETEPACRAATEIVQELGTTATPVSPGKLGQYELLAKLGEGGMGAVYKARHAKLDKIVALKILPPERTKDTSAVARFEREMRAVGKLDHPHIVRAMDAGEVDGMHFLVMEYVEGIDLGQLVQQRGPLPIAEACELVRQAAIGLDEAHQQGMVHRDIKPANLMLCRTSAIRNPQSAIVKILDLGLALLSDAHTADPQGLTGSGQLMGTIDYMAPEQGGDSHVVDIRADIYSLGATLYKLLTGEAIYQGANFQTPVQKLMALANQPAPSIQSRRPGIPNELAKILHRMLEKSPSQRYSTPKDVADALAPFCTGADLAGLLDGNPQVPHVENRAAPPLDADRQPAPQRSGPFSLALAAVGIAALLAAIVLYWRIPQGTVRIEISDPGITAQVDAQGVQFKQGDQKAIYVESGKHGLRVKHGEFEFETDKFILKRGEDVRLKIELLPGQIQVSKEGEVFFRKDLPPAESDEGWVQLFNRRDLTGWKMHPDQRGQWRVEQGLLVGSGPQSHLFSERGDFADFHLRVETRVNADGDSGIMFRSPYGFLPRFPNGWMFPAGYEAQICNKSAEHTNTGSVYPLFGVRERLVEPNAWFQLEVIAQGNHITLLVNGRTIVDMTDTEQRFSVGHFALQVMDPVTTIEFRKIEIKEDRVESAPSPAEAPWIALSEGGLSQWEQEARDWREVGSVELDPTVPTRLNTKPGVGVLYCPGNGKQARNLITTRDFGDLELQAEFMVPHKGNSGIFLLSHYELQVLDSWGAPRPAIYDCGAVFPCRVTGHAIEGHGQAPLENASLRPGQWQTFEVIFRAPRFDAARKVLSPARFERVALNGKVVQHDADVTSPVIKTAMAPLFLQGGLTDIAYRNVRARPLPPATVPPAYTNSLGMRFAHVPAGKSWLWGGGGKPGVQEVEFKEDFYLGVYEVTQEEWQKVTGLSPSHFSRHGQGKDVVKDVPDAELKRFPIESVSYDDIQTFLARLNEMTSESGWTYRLPREAEWEYACRGGPMSDRSQSAFDGYFDKPVDLLLPEHANFACENSPQRTCRVGQYPPNPLGLHDMIGNVWELCDDAVTDDKPAPGRRLRGGFWGDTQAYCRAAGIGWAMPQHRAPGIGFRLARVRTSAAIDPGPQDNTGLVPPFRREDRLDFPERFYRIPIDSHDPASTRAEGGISCSTRGV